MSRINYRRTKWFRDLKKKGAFCYYCGVEIKGPTLTIDHRIPYSKGGRGQDNLVPCCLKCNREKRQMTDKEYFQYIDFKIQKGFLI